MVRVCQSRTHFLPRTMPGRAGTGTPPLYSQPDEDRYIQHPFRGAVWLVPAREEGSRSGPSGRRSFREVSVDTAGALPYGYPSEGAPGKAIEQQTPGIWVCWFRVIRRWVLRMARVAATGSLTDRGQQ